MERDEGKATFLLEDSVELRPHFSTEEMSELRQLFERAGGAGGGVGGGVGGGGPHPHPEIHLQQLIKFLHKLLNINDRNACVVLSAIYEILNGKPELAHKYLERVFASNSSILFEKIMSSDNMYDALIISTIQYLDTYISSLMDRELSQSAIALCQSSAEMVLHFHFASMPIWSNFYQNTIFILSSFELLYKIITVHSQYAKDHNSELFGLAAAYILYGVDTKPLTAIKPHKINVSQQALYEYTDDLNATAECAYSRCYGGKVSKVRKPRVVRTTRQLDITNMSNLSGGILNEMFSLDIKTSDSDTSEAENSNNTNVDRHRCSKVRLTSILLLGLITKAQDRRVLYGFWHALLPICSDETSENLLYVAQHDPNVRCRCAALQVISHLLLGSKNYLSQADYANCHTQASFTSFSRNLGFTIVNLYDVLTGILSTDSSLPVITQTLKCLAVLVQATSFNRLKPGVIKQFVQVVRPLVTHRDCSIQVSALMVLEFLLCSSELSHETKFAVGFEDNIAKSTNLVQIDSSENNNTNHSTYWLMDQVLQNITSVTRTPPPILIESLQVLSAITGHLNLLNSLHIERIGVVLSYALEDSLKDVQLYAARCVDKCAYQLSIWLLQKKDFVNACDIFWDKLLPVIFKQFSDIHIQSATIKVCLCDALSNIGVTMFERISYVQQMKLLSFISGISSDNTEETIVRAAAVRALAVYVLFPSLRENLVFIENTAELTLRLANDTNLPVRVKIFWSIGNLSDALINADGNERISFDLLKRLLDATLAASNDNDKVRCNSVRALGNLLRLFTEKHLIEIECRTIFQKVIEKLIDFIRSPGNAKVKWNACYAISNIMRNPNLFSATIKFVDFNWQDSLYPALCHVIVYHSNFKVRINATSIILMGNRSYFGNYFEMIWSSLLEAIDQTTNLRNFYEYNHRDNLQEQLCLAVCHYISIADLDDLALMKKCLATKAEVMHNTWIRVINRMVPEKAAPLLSCSTLLLVKYKCNIELSIIQRNNINFIAQTFTTAELS